MIEAEAHWYGPDYTYTSPKGTKVTVYSPDMPGLYYSPGIAAYSPHVKEIILKMFPPIYHDLCGACYYPDRGALELSTFVSSNERQTNENVRRVIEAGNKEYMKSLGPEFAASAVGVLGAAAQYALLQQGGISPEEASIMLGTAASWYALAMLGINRTQSGISFYPKHVVRGVSNLSALFRDKPDLYKPLQQPHHGTRASK